MYKQIFDNNLITIGFDEEDRIMVVDWKQNCGNIVENQHSEEQAVIRKYINTERPRKLLVDMSSCVYHIKPDTAPWYENTLFSMYTDLSPKRIALIIPRNLFEHAFFDAARSRENADPNTRIQYFDDLKKAKYWLIHAEPLSTQI
ncbi:MAG: hypothetical protein ACLFPE_06010 [Bacteroidales bacterium]